MPWHRLLLFPNLGIRELVRCGESSALRRVSRRRRLAYLVGRFPTLVARHRLLLAEDSLPQLLETRKGRYPLYPYGDLATRSVSLRRSNWRHWAWGMEKIQGRRGSKFSFISLVPLISHSLFYLHITKYIFLHSFHPHTEVTGFSAFFL